MLVCPLARLYIREMNAHLAIAEEQLHTSIKGSVELGVELHHWRNNPHMLDHENDMHRHSEIDIIPESGKISAEYMTGKRTVRTSILTPILPSFLNCKHYKRYYPTVASNIIL